MAGEKMYHPRLQGSHYEMGQKMGTIFQKSKAEFPIYLDPFQIEFGRESAILLKKYFPEATEEIKGITDVIKYDHDLFTAWMMCMGCCLDLDPDSSLEARGCTAFSFINQGKVYYGRNNDLPPFLKKVCKSIYYHPRGKLGFILNTSSFVNGEEGINESGLVAAMTFVKPKWEEIKPGINSVFLVRYILEYCRNVSEGIKSLNRLPIASSCNIILTDKTGEMVVAECNPAEIHVRYPDKNKNGEKFIITVNHFTSEVMQKHDASNGNAYYSKERYQTAFEALKNIIEDDGMIYARDILSGKYGFICQYQRKLNFDTIWSSLFDITGNRVFRAEGNPRRSKYIRDRRLKFPRDRTLDNIG
jgi:predicted choloylglycine hydrolase